MGDNSNPSTSAAPPKPKRGNPHWRPYYRRGFNHNNVPREKPVAFQISDTHLNEEGSSVGPNQKSSTIFLNTKCEDYPAWHLYFFDEKYEKNSPTVQKVKAFEKHFSSNCETYNYYEIKKKCWFVLNLQFLLSDDQFIKSWITFQQDLNENPELVLNCAGVAMHKLVTNNIETTQTSCLIFETKKSFLQTIRPRLHGFGPIVNLKSLRGGKYEKLIAIRGTVIRAEPTTIDTVWVAFKCKACNTEQVVRQPDGIETFPTSCKGQCRARSNFIPIKSSSYTKSIQLQKIRIQETILGQVPTIIEAELSEDLINVVCPGDDITLTGILKVKRVDEVQRRDQPNLSKLYIKAVSILTNKNAMTNRETDFKTNDIEAIKAISEEPNLFRLLVQSLSPTIYGHEMVKAGLILALFGASNSHQEQDQEGKRTEIHVLLVGDPGVGKSHMLQACANASPRGIFVCGNTSTNAGLTASVRQERHHLGGGGSIEAGAIVLADQGACCIDEFDKMASNHESLLEVMEDQTVSIAKANVLCKIPARTSIIAAANPKTGFYDRSRTVSENLKMKPALLSRFDLVFILLDRPNVRLDTLLTKHIQALNSNETKSSSTWKCSNKENQYNSNIQQTENDPLEERLKIKPNENLDLLPHVLFQKYITYTRKYINPHLTPEAGTILKNFFSELRKARTGVDSLPVTIRQLEGLIRLSQARARLELSKVVTVEHALDVLAITRYSLVDVYSTDSGELEITRNINGSGMSQLTLAKKFIKALQIYSASSQKTIFEVKELKEIASDAGLPIMNFSQLIDSLNLQGILLKKGQNIYRFLTD